MKRANFPFGIFSGLIIILLTTSSSATVKGLQMTDLSKFKDVKQEAFENATISYGSVQAPLGSFVVVKNLDDVCAVRFTETHRGHDSKAPSTFSSGEENLYAEYDWYYQGDGSGDLSKANVKSGHDKLRRGPMRGINRLSIQSGTTVVTCGPFKLGWRYPAAVGFNTTYRKEGDVGNEIAPTRWRELRDLSVGALGLKWYRFDESRKDFVIPADQL